jgi:hypothetical protein
MPTWAAGLSVVLNKYKLNHLQKPFPSKGFWYIWKLLLYL